MKMKREKDEMERAKIVYYYVVLFLMYCAAAARFVCVFAGPIRNITPFVAPPLVQTATLLPYSGTSETGERRPDGYLLVRNRLTAFSWMSCLLFRFK